MTKEELLEKISRNDFMSGYFEAILWAETDDDGEPLETYHGIEDFYAGDLKEAHSEALVFYRQAEPILDEIDGDDAQAGHDFWLTRVGHGAGFWDGDWPEPAATKLTELAEDFGEVWVYVGDDGKLGFSR